MALALPLDPRPASIEAVLDSLSPTARAQLAWFPTEFRLVVVAGLRGSRTRDLLRDVDRLVLPAFRLFVRMSETVAQLIESGALDASMRSQRIIERDARLDARMRSIDPVAAAMLREARAWMDALLSSLLLQHRQEMAALHGTAPKATPEDDLVKELRGPGGSFFRGLLLTLAADDVLNDESARPPRNIARWCELALREIEAAANTLRASGLIVPTALPPRARRDLHLVPKVLVPGPLPPGLEGLLVTELRAQQIWLFGSRARGDNAPRSDWDILAVIPDEVSIDERVRNLVQRLARERVDLFVVSRTEFADGRHVPGTLSHIACTEGLQVVA